jgi:hypothetical protein
VPLLVHSIGCPCFNPPVKTLDRIGRESDQRPEVIVSGELSDGMAAKLHMTVPPGFRRMAAMPEVLRLGRARLSGRDVQTIDGVRVTEPLPFAAMTS